MATLGGAILVAGCAALWVLVGTGVLHLLPRLGRVGRWMEERARRAPVLDLVVAYFLVAPWLIGAIMGGWWWFGGAIVGQIGGGIAWMQLHELWMRPHGREAKLVRALNRVVGPVRNHAALWVTVIAVPAFLFVRLAEVIAYPLLVWLVRFPRCKQSDWVTVSRHKFDGLVGFDRVWCLYCDWMTGVWALGGEMLRNLESFWCPIRFSDVTKCEKCARDFPDLDNGWVPADGTIDDVVALVERKYTPGSHPNAWFGHPVRLTIDGISPQKPATSPSASAPDAPITLESDSETDADPGSTDPDRPS